MPGVEGLVAIYLNVVGVASALAGPLATVIVAIGASYAISAVTAAIIGRPKAPDPNSIRGGFTLTTRMAAGARRLIYGALRCGGEIVYMETSHQNRFLHIVVALAGHECEAIDDILLDTVSITDEKFGSTPVAANTSIAIEELMVFGVSQGWRIVSRGEGGESGPPAGLVDFEAAGFHAGDVIYLMGMGANDGYWEITNTKGQDTTGLIYNSGVSWQDGVPSVPSYWESYIRVRPITPTAPAAMAAGPAVTIARKFAWYTTHLGTADQAADATLIGFLPDKWTADHRLQGITYIYVGLAHNVEVWKSGAPNITALVRGKKVYDPRTGLTAWSNNAALCVADYLHDAKYGLGAAYGSKIATAELIAAANACDEDISILQLPAWFPFGQGGAITEKRYTCNGIVDTEQTPKDIIQGLASAMAGTAVYTGGQWSILTGVYRTPTVTLNEDDLRAELQVTTRISRRELFNAVKGTFISPANDWQPADFPPITSATYEAEDGGTRLFKDVELPFTTSSATAQRLVKLDLYKTRQQITVKAPCKLSALPTRVGDNVYLNNARMGWTDKPFEIIDWAFSVYEDETGAPALGVDLVLRETAPECYAWSIGEEQAYDPAPNTTLDSPLRYAALPVAIAESLQIDTPASPGGSLSTITLTVTPPADSLYAGAVVYYQKQGDTAWYRAGRTDDAGQVSFVVAADGARYNIAAKSLSTLGWESLTGLYTVVTVNNVVYAQLTDDVAAMLPPPDVAGLELFGQGNDEEFGGRDAKFAWRPLAVEDWYELGFEPLGIGAGAGAQEQYFRDYEVRVLDTDGTLSRVEWVTDTWYVYTYEKNAEDHAGVAVRSFSLEVYARTRQNQLSARAARITVSNPQPALPTAVTLVPGFQLVTLQYTPPADLDYEGLIVWMDTTTEFTPSEANKVYQGAGAPIKISGLVAGTTYYLRYAAFDAFGVAGITVSGELSVTTSKITTTDMLGLSAWATRVEPADEAFILSVLTDDAVPSQKIKNLTAAKITTGILYATVQIQSAGLISAVSGAYSVDLGPTAEGAKVALLRATNGVTTPFAIFEDGSAYFSGQVVIGGSSSGYANFSDKPASLSDVNTTEGTKLSGIEPGADVTANNTAAGIAGQGALATANAADWSTQVTGTGKPADNADVTQTIIDGGLITTGYIQLSTAGNIRSGKTAFSDTANAGFWIGNDAGTPKIRIGNAGHTRGWVWDGNVLDIVGQLRASSFITTGSYLTAALSGGETTIPLADTSDFPTSGSGWIIDSTNDRDAFSWTGKTATTLTGCSGVLAHNAYALVVPADKSILLDQAVNEMRFFGERSTGIYDELVSIGLKSSGGDSVIVNIGRMDLEHPRLPLNIQSKGNGIKCVVDLYTAIYAQSNNDTGIVANGKQYGGRFYCNERDSGGYAPIWLEPSGFAGAPSTVPSYATGALWVDSNGILYIYTPSGWQKVGAQ